MEVFARGDWVRLNRVVGVTQQIHLSMTDGSTVVIDSPESSLISKKKEAIEFGKAIYGWLLFGGPLWLDGANISQYRLTCIDVFDKQHIIVTEPERFTPVPLFRELAGFRVEPFDASSLTPGARPR